MKIKTSELSGAALDWAVAKAAYNCSPAHIEDSVLGFWYSGESDGGCMDWGPSTNWSQCGPLIDKYELNLVGSDGYWSCVKEWYGPEIQNNYPDGDNPVAAICRAVVTIELGDEVEIPEELL